MIVNYYCMNPPEQEKNSMIHPRNVISSVMMGTVTGSFKSDQSHERIGEGSSSE